MSYEDVLSEIEARRPLDDAAPVRAPRLQTRTFAELRAEVSARGARKWLVEGLIIEGQHGVLGGKPKAGKGWDGLDLAVSVASGTPYLDRFACPHPGRVLLFASEEDDYEIKRRVEAIARSRDLDPDDLEVEVCTLPPRLANTGDMEEVEGLLAKHRPVLTILDPLYRSAGGGDYKSLLSIGGLLGDMEELTRQYASALLVIHHLNRSSDAKGAARLSGAGVEEWGRFLIVTNDPQRFDIEGGTEVLRTVEVTGTSIADHNFNVRRRVTSDDPEDADAALTYFVKVEEVTQLQRGKRPPAQKSILRVLDGADNPITRSEAVDRIVSWGIFETGIRQKAFERAAKRLLAEDSPLIDHAQSGPGRPDYFWRTDVPAHYMAAIEEEGAAGDILVP